MGCALPIQVDGSVLERRLLLLLLLLPAAACLLLSLCVLASLCHQVVQTPSIVNIAWK